MIPDDQETAPDHSAPRVIAGRYAITGVLGSGGGGIVYRAEDRLLGRTVAVKTLRPGIFVSEPRIRREIAALRLLRLPGVVALHDEVEEDGAVHLVMDHVPGAHFPGPAPRGDWAAIASPVRALLETLGRVHAAGVVHRDLKPANVLVDDDGRVTLLDFGLSFGPALGGGLTLTGAVVGTPEYLAPEQIRGRGIDGRTDLYALGVMLYEVLSGRLPIEARDFADLMRRKISSSTVPLARAAPEIPRHVAAVVDRMLSVAPDDRPASAVAALRMLFGNASDSGDPELPRLGATDALARLLRAADDGISIDVCGGHGSGRSRLVRDAADALEAAGRQVSWAGRGRSPYSALTTVLGTFEGLRDLTGEEAFAELDARLVALLSDGHVILVDDPDALDRWSAAALLRVRSAGTVIRVVSERTPGCVELQPFDEAALRPLFAGPSRLLHLPEDAAAELWRRTGGQPARVRAELSAWVRHGFAEWVDGRVVIGRAALSRLAGGLPVGAGPLSGMRSDAGGPAEFDDVLAWIALAWPHADFDLLARVTGRPRWMLEPEIRLLVDDGLVRCLDDGRLQPLVVPEALQVWRDDERRAAHRALAAALPAGAPARLWHLAAGGGLDEVVEEALALAAALVEQGRPAEARAALSIALTAARGAADEDAADRVLLSYVRACLSDGTPAAANEGLYEIERAPTLSPAVRDLHRFLLAVLETQRGVPERALEMLDACGPFDDEDLELWRQSQRARASARLPIDRHEAVIEQLTAWAEATDSPRALTNLRVWRAALLMRQGRPAAAAALHRQGADDSESTPARMADLLNVGSALLESGLLDDALAAGRAARDMAAACRHPLYEAWAESLVRDVAYRLGELDAPDHELLSAVAVIGSPELEGVVTLTEAAVAWRAGLLGEARELATRAAAIWAATGYDASRLIMRALEVACGDTLPADEAVSLAAELADEPDRFAAAQACGLLADHADGDAARRLRDTLQVIARDVGAATRAARREVISIDEALVLAGVAIP